MPMNDQLYMKRAIELAGQGRGFVSPNPMVGCVIVHEDTVIGEGWHKAYGGPHSEVNAISSVSDAELLPQSTCYVTLEPCSHHGKTPPCADLLIEKRIKRVVIGCTDTNPLVGGKGIERLKAAGIEVEVDVLKAECRKLNSRFFTAIEKQRPYIILKWAQTADGFVARSNYDSKWISNQASRTLVHQWRAEEDAILVGKGTALHDNPRLNVRDWDGKDPIRILLDRNLELSGELHLFDRSQDTIVFNTLRSESEHGLERVKIEGDFLPGVLRALHEHKVQSLFVEGGAAVLGAFISEGFWDEARVFTSTRTFGDGISAPDLGVEADEQYEIETDKLKIYHNG